MKCKLLECRDCVLYRDVSSAPRTVPSLVESLRKYVRGMTIPELEVKWENQEGGLVHQVLVVEEGNQRLAGGWQVSSITVGG